MKPCAFIASIIAATLVGCGSGASDSTPEGLIREQVQAISTTHWGRVFYDTLYPPQQQLVAYRDFARCMEAASTFARKLGYDLSTARFDGIRDTKQQRITVPGTGERVHATVVRYGISYEVGGKRLSGSEADPRYLVKVGGHWRWIEQSEDLRAMKRQDCGFERG